MTRARVPLLALALLVFGISPARAEELQRIIVIPGSHLDVGFTAPPSVVTAKRVATLDAAIEAAEKDPAFRWTEECGYVVHAWLEAHGKDPARVARLKALVQAKRIGMGACWVNPHAALFPPRSLIVLFAWHDEAEKAFGIRPSVAIVNDVPSVPEALVDAAAASGVEAFLCGSNLAFSPPLPTGMVSGPFVRTTARGARAIFSVDPDSYTAAFTRWGIDPAAARFFAKERFGGLEGNAVTRAGITEAGKGRSGVVVVQQAFDNWGIDTALRLPPFAASWNASETPKVVPATPSDALAAWKSAKDLPTREGEWDGTWEEVRAQVPQWTARLRVAAAGPGPRVDLDRWFALATAMDHTGTLGPCWPGMLTEAETVQHNAEWAAIFKAAIGPTEDRRALAMLSSTNELRMEEGTKRPDRLPKGLDAAALDPAVRRGKHGLAGAWFEADSPVARSKTGIEGDDKSVTLWARVDRGVLPGDDQGIVVAGWDLPLSAARKDVALAPLGPDGKARGGKRLLGRDPDTWIAPDGVEVRGPDFALIVTSSHAFSWRLVERDGKARLQAMLVRQSRRCEFKGGGGRALAFEDLYPGEPRFLDAELVVSVSAR